MITRQQSLPDHRLFSTVLFILASRQAKRLWHSIRHIRVAVFAAVSSLSMRIPVRCFGKPSICRTMADGRGEPTAAPFYHPPPLFTPPAPPSFTLATTHP